MIKIVDALGHGDMIVTTEATESGLNGRSIHLPLISSAVKTAWENALGVLSTKVSPGLFKMHIYR